MESKGLAPLILTLSTRCLPTAGTETRYPALAICMSNLKMTLLTASAETNHSFGNGLKSCQQLRHSTLLLLSRDPG